MHSCTQSTMHKTSGFFPSGSFDCFYRVGNGFREMEEGITPLNICSIVHSDRLNIHAEQHTSSFNPGYDGCERGRQRCNRFWNLIVINEYDTIQDRLLSCDNDQCLRKRDNCRAAYGGKSEAWVKTFGYIDDNGLYNQPCVSDKIR